MSNVSPLDFPLAAVINAYKQQIAEGLTTVSHGRVESETGVARSTCARLWRKGRRATSTAAAVPPLEKLVLQPVAAEITAAATPAPAPSVPPLAPTVEVLPVGPSVAAIEQAEFEALKIIRYGVTGVGAVSTTLLAGLQPLALAAKKQLELSAETGQADAVWVIGQLDAVSRSLARAAAAMSALVAAQGVLVGRASVIQEHRGAAPPVDDPDVRAEQERLLKQLVDAAARKQLRAREGYEAQAGGFIMEEVKATTGS